MLSGTFLLAADDATPVELGAGDCFLLAGLPPVSAFRAGTRHARTIGPYRNW